MFTVTLHRRVGPKHVQIDYKRWNKGLYACMLNDINVGN